MDNEHSELPPIETSSDAIDAALWEDGESRATLFLRAVITLVAGGFLLWAQHRAPINSGAEWSRWVWLSVAANFVLPLFMVWMFFGQGLGHLEWLRDQKYNAWNYGWNFRDWRRHLKLAAAMCALMLPILWLASRDANTQLFYQKYFPPVADARGWLWLLGTLTIYMFCWEWFHRGFLLFGMAQGFGPFVAIALQAAVFAAAHAGKPRLEFIGALFGGLILGAIAWREKSFAPAFYTHALVHIAWAFLILS